MDRTVTPFLFEGGLASTGAILVAEIPLGLQTEDGLLQEIARQLRFPDYFGANWDALWDCLRDLSWLPGGLVVLKHSDLPLAEDPAGRKIYLSILRDVVNKRWSGSTAHDLIVGFPPTAREEIEQILERE